MKTYFKKKTSRLAPSAHLKGILSLGDHYFSEFKINNKKPSKYPLELILCEDCKLLQLKHTAPSSELYTNNYGYRSSISGTIKSNLEEISQEALALVNLKQNDVIVDIGCNDGYLLRLLEEKGGALLGVDPIWTGKSRQLSQKISVQGGFIEKVDFRQAMSQEPDLVVSAHTFEHLEQPKEVLQSVVSRVQDNTLFVIEVPSFDTLVYNHRFDQVFHQHIQYFSLASFYHMVQDLGCSYLAHRFNYSMWGGTMLFAFQKTGVSEKLKDFVKHTANSIIASYESFIAQLRQLQETIRASPAKKIYGFGAAQMLPSLVYHIPGQLSQVQEILDDNIDRQGLMYPSLPFVIANPNTVDVANADVVITALDSARPILSRLMSLGVKRILHPLNLI